MKTDEIRVGVHDDICCKPEFMVRITVCGSVSRLQWLQELETVVTSDEAQILPKAREESENCMTVYIGYRSALSLLTEISELLVFPPRRNMCTELLEYVGLRVCELRTVLKQALGGSFDQELYATMDRLGVCPDIQTSQLVPKTHPHDPRFQYLLDCFSPQQASSHAPTVPVVRRNTETTKLEQPIRKYVQPSTIRLTLDEAVTRIASTFRMWNARRKFIASRDSELVELGLLPPPQDAACVEEAEQFKRSRKDRARFFESEWENLRRSASEKYRAEARDSLLDGFSAETRRAVWKFRESTGKFPDSVETLIAPPPEPVALQPKKKTTAKSSPQVAAVPQWSTLVKLRGAIDNFSWDQQLVILSDQDKKEIYDEAKRAIVCDINKWIQGLRGSDFTTVTETGFDEQDIIDLIKAGILVKSKDGEGFQNFHANIFSSTGLECFKNDVIETIVNPLASELIWSHSNPPRSVLLYGPRGCGKTHVARAIAKASGSCLFMVPVDVSSETVELIQRVAVHLSPSVILIDSLDDMLHPKTVPKKKKKSEPSDTVSILEIVLDKLVTSGRSVLICCSLNPDEVLMKKFKASYLLPLPNEDDRTEIMKQTFLRRAVPVKIVRSNLVLIRGIAQLCEAMSIADIKSMVESVLTEERVQLVATKPLRPDEFISQIKV